MPTAKELLQSFEKLKTISPVGVRLMRLAEDKSATIKEIGEVVKLDPTLVAHLLRLVNSPYYALLNRIETIDSAVVLIGMENLRNMIAVATVKDVFSSGSPDEIFSPTTLWLHCAAVGICAKMISERIFGKLGEDAFLGGLLHDVGMIMEYQTVPDLFFQACKAYDPQHDNFTACEQKIIGTDHCEAGHTLIVSWSLPDSVQLAIKEHHSVSQVVSPSDMTGLIQISDYIVSRIGYAAMPAMKPQLSPLLGAHLKDKKDEYKALIKEMPDELSKARDIYDIKES